MTALDGELSIIILDSRITVHHEGKRKTFPGNNHYYTLFLQQKYIN